MELEIVKLSPDEYTQTSSGNKIFKSNPTSNTLFGTQNIVIHGKTILMCGCMLRGDLCAIRMGKYCYVGERTIIRAGHKKFSKGASLINVHIGDFVIIQSHCILAASQIGSYTFIGKGSIVGRSSIIKECCRVEPNSVIPADTVFPPFSIIAGNPGLYLEEFKMMGVFSPCCGDSA